MVDKPGENASTKEIARWLEDDFWDSFAEGIGTEEAEESQD